MPLTTAEYARGALFGLAAVSIWSGGIVAVGLGLRTNLTPWDIAAVRFAVAGSLLLPYVLVKGLALTASAAPDWLRSCSAAVRLSCCLTQVCCSRRRTCRSTLSRRDAADGGGSGGIHAQRHSRHEKARLRVDPARRLRIAWFSGGTLGAQQNIGHAFFLGSGVAFAFYTVAMRRARLDGLHAAAIAAVGDLLLYVPVYWMFVGTTSLAKAAWTDIALQAVVQRLLTATISYVLYGRAVSILGASSGAAFAALCPAMTALMAIPVLGEWPGPWTGWPSLRSRPASTLSAEDRSQA